MKILGIDQSLTETGYFVLDTATQEETFGVITPSKDLEPIDRLDVLFSRFGSLIYETAPQVIGIEGYGFCGKGRARELGELGGILRLFLVRERIKTWEVPVGTLKKFVSGKGNAQKDLMLLKTFKNFGIEFENHNISDAFGICAMVSAIEKQANNRLPVRFNKAQEEALKVPTVLVKGVEVTARARIRPSI